MSSVDTNKDGQLSKDEIQAIPAERRGTVEGADSDNDGNVSRQELLKAIKARFGG